MTPRPRKNLISAFILVVAVVFSVVGCTVPDLKPFSDATVALNAGVREGGDQIVQSMLAFPFKKDGRMIPSSSKEHPAHQLRQLWRVRIQAMDALVLYSESLANIADAGYGARKNVAVFGQTVQSLGKYIPLASSYTGDVKVLIDTLITSGIEIQSYRSLQKAVQRAREPMGNLVELIGADLSDLIAINKNLRSIGVALLTKELDAELATYNDTLNLRKFWWDKLEDRSEEARALEMINQYDTILEVNRRNVETRSKTLTDFKLKSDGLEMLLVRTKDAVGHWKKANDDLASALSDNRRPNIGLLVTRTMEIKQAVERLSR